MVSETSDVQHFIAEQALFQHLDYKSLEQVCSNIYTAFSKSGSQLSYSYSDRPADDKRPGLIMVRSGSLEIRGDSNELIDRLSSGDFLLPHVIAESSSITCKVSVLEDCLYYEIADTAFQSLYSSDRDVAYLCDSYARRFSHTSPSGSAVTNSTAIVSPFEFEHRPLVLRENFLDQSVSAFMSSPAVTALPDMSVFDAAKLMRDKNVSSLLITAEQALIGIVTDRDLRTRVLAEGIVTSAPISTVMTAQPRCIDADAALHQAQLIMMGVNIHHLPVVNGQKPVGLIGLSDIVRANNSEPLSLTGSIKRAMSVAELAAIAKQFPELVATLIERDTRAVDVGEIITTLSDALTRRLIQLAEAGFGEPPCEYVWLAFGSQARQEQVLGSDQDNAIIVQGEKRELHDAYFQQLANFVNDGLDQCGMVLCPGDIMARNSKWRMNLIDWKACFQQWIEQPSPKALMHASIFFDMRAIWGNSNLVDELRASVLARARKNTIFLALMSDNALSHSPPLGFFKTFVLEKDGDHNRSLELKKRGTIPIVDIARNYSLSAAITEVNTTARLKACEQKGLLSKSLASSLIDAHEFIAGIRLQSQGNKYRAGERVDNHLDPKTLSPLVRHQLKEAFHLVRQAQSAMKARFGGGIL